MITLVVHTIYEYKWTILMEYIFIHTTILKKKEKNWIFYPIKLQLIKTLCDFFLLFQRDQLKTKIPTFLIEFLIRSFQRTFWKIQFKSRF